MISIQVEQNVIYTVAEEKLTNEDYDRLIPLLQEKVRSFGAIRWYFEMNEFEGWSLGAIWRDIKFDFKNAENMERIAMVGNKEWEKELTQLMKPFTKARVKFFELTEKDEAKNWIRKIEI
ncbi:STAS/SEC14 domain-containing protein [Salinimicrobium tongyeongense]|uniref:STAS/SEC14 domain-containing protein n=1 Tax=Salinimicrobium tongyeongense TaxID=2809707 RepID=A0ABY6NPT2_9FLAO|nr:STAS/SEC14 domain-containing protein [Salinimicrobium tongyeongense]UZH54899.1 STAS/SEC14 domain-containing protein [Salinimicrobium tongyeongense]